MVKPERVGGLDWVSEWVSLRGGGGLPLTNVDA